MIDLPPPTAFVCMITPFSTPQSTLAAIIKIPPAKPADQTYQDLVCTEADKEGIAKIVTMLGENGKISILLNQGYLKALGAQIDHVHPLKFLSTVFSNPELKASMRKVFDDYFKRNGFMEGLGPNMTREQEKGKLYQYIPDFAKEVDIPIDNIRFFFQTSDWEGLVQFLIDS